MDWIIIICVLLMPIFLYLDHKNTKERINRIEHAFVTDLTHQALTKKTDALRFVDYPKGSRQNPFDIDSKGKYFAYQRNRCPAISYMDESLEKFDDEVSGDMLRAMSPGYVKLFVLKRLSVWHNGIEYKCDENIDNKKVVSLYALWDGKSFYIMITEEEYKRMIDDVPYEPNECIILRLDAELVNYYGGK